MSTQASGLIRLTSVQEIPEGGGREFRIGQRYIAVFRYQGTFYALEDACPHAGAPLNNGMLKDGTVMCMWHAWRFNLKDGVCQNIRKAPPVPTFPVTIQGDDLYVTLPGPEGE